MDRSVFEQRRRRVIEAIGPDAVAIFPAAPERTRSNDVEYRYRQHNDFYYLTGFPEPGAVCVLRPGHASEEYVLFVRPRDRERETWTGRRAGVEGAVTEYGAAMAYPIEELDQRLPPMVAESRASSTTPWTATRRSRGASWAGSSSAQLTRPRTGHGPTGLLDARAPLHEMRLHKELAEIDCMRRAIAISAQAHAAAMREARAGRWEYEIEALIDYVFRRNGAAGPAYPSIVASGANATILHYTTNDRCLEAGDLLLIDAGAEYDFYCADVTRTFPVGAALRGPREGDLRARARRAAGRDRSGAPRRPLRRTAPARRAYPGRRPGRSRRALRLSGRDRAEGTLQAGVHAPHQPLARHGRP